MVVEQWAQTRLETHVTRVIVINNTFLTEGKYMVGEYMFYFLQD